MNTIFRIFFQSFGLASLLVLIYMDPDNALFSDFLRVLQAEPFWAMVSLFAITLFSIHILVNQSIEKIINAAMLVFSRFNMNKAGTK